MALLDALQAIASGIPSARKTMQGFNNLQAQQQKMRQQQKINPLQLQMLQEKAQMQPQLDQSQLAERQARDQLLQHQAKAPYSTVGKTAYDIANTQNPKQRALAMGIAEAQSKKPQLAAYDDKGRPMYTPSSGANLQQIYNTTPSAQASHINKALGLSDSIYNQEHGQRPSGGLTSQMLRQAGVSPQMQGQNKASSQAQMQHQWIPDERAKKGGVYRDEATGETRDMPTSADRSRMHKIFDNAGAGLKGLQRLKELGSQNQFGLPPFIGDTGNEYKQTLAATLDTLLSIFNLPKTSVGAHKIDEALTRGQTQTPESYRRQVQTVIDRMNEKIRQMQEEARKGYNVTPRFTKEDAKTFGLNYDDAFKHYNSDNSMRNEDSKKSVKIGSKSYSMKDIRDTANKHNLTTQQVISRLRQNNEGFSVGGLVNWITGTN